MNHLRVKGLQEKVWPQTAQTAPPTLPPSALPLQGAKPLPRYPHIHAALAPDRRSSLTHTIHFEVPDAADGTQYGYIDSTSLVEAGK